MFITKEQYKIAKEIAVNWVKTGKLENRYISNVLNIQPEFISYLAALDEREKELSVKVINTYEDSQNVNKNFKIEIGKFYWNDKLEHNYKVVYFNNEIIYFDMNCNYFENNNSI